MFRGRLKRRAGTRRYALAVLGASLVSCGGARSSNAPPTAQSQELIVEEDGLLSGQLIATDANGDQLKFAVMNPTRHGKMDLDAATGSFTYRPRRSFRGSDAFSFVVSDGKATSNPAFVVVSVQHSDRPPLAVNHAVFAPTDGTVVGVLWAEDEENELLNFSITQPPANGTLEFDAATRIFTYNPIPGFTGEDLFQFTASDAHGVSAPGTVSIQVLGTAPTGPEIQVQQGTSTAVVGQAAIMGVVASSATPLHFVWWKNGKPIPGATAAAYITPPVTMADTGTSFSVTAYDALGGSATSLSWTLVAIETLAGQRTESLFSNESDLFPKRNPLSVTSIEALSSAMGAKVSFDSSSLGFPALKATGDAAVVPDPLGNALFIAFADHGVPEVQSETVTVSPVGSSNTFTLALSYTNAMWFAERGLSRPANVTFTEMGVPLASTCVEDWIIGQPSASDVTFAQTTWGPTVAGLTTPTAKAQAIARSLIDKLEGHRGVPSDTLSNSAPFVQYQMAISGQGQVWCTNISQIFALACNSLGIPARIVAMGRTLSLGPFYNVVTSEGHATTEIFDGTTNTWVWIDPTIYLLGMQRAGFGLLNTLHMHQDLNDPARSGELFTIHYDPSTATMTVSDIAHSPALPDLQRFFDRESILSIWKNGPELPFEFHSNEHGVFPRLEDLAIKSIEALPGGYGVRLKLSSAIPDLDHFEYRQVGASSGGYDASTHASADGVMNVAFSDPRAPVPQSMQFTVKAVGLSGTSSAEPVLTIYLYSTEYYASVGVNTRGVVIFSAGDLRYVSSVPEQWLVDTPSLADFQFAEAEWGKALSVTATALENARALARTILDRLVSRHGLTSSAMSISPFDLYRRAISGTDLIDVNSLAAIFSHACNALGVPARIVVMDKVLSRTASYDLLGTENRSAVEIFDSVGNRWVWFDLSAGLLGVEQRGYGALNTAELGRALNDPIELPRLVAISYDPVKGVETRAEFTLGPGAEMLQSFFRAYPTLRYARLER